MKKFLAVYHAPASVIAAMANISPEEKAKGMEPWMAWMTKCGDKMVDFGAPLMPGHTTSVSGTWSPSTTDVTGYSIVQGENIDEVKALFEDHPHISWANGCSIEIHETIAM